MFKMFKMFTALSLGLVLLAASAFATSFTAPQTVTVGPFGTTGAFHGLTFNKFDSSLGTITDFHVTFDATGFATYEFHDISGSANTFQFAANVTVNLESPIGGSPLAVVIPGLSDIQRTVAANGTYDVPGFANPLIGLSGSASSGNLTYTTPAALLAAFNGNAGDMITLNSDATITTNFNANNDATNTVVSRYNATATIQYSYDAATTGVPEPTTLALFGSALVGLAVLRRRGFLPTRKE